MSNHYEDTIWKQITTSSSSAFASSGLWAIITKIQSESKSQRIEFVTAFTFCCEQSLRRYNLKANHNPKVQHCLLSSVVSNHYEDTIWKQITTIYRVIKVPSMLWAIITKIQSESKSQQSRGITPSYSVVSNHYEDTIWKQITTAVWLTNTHFRLWAIITKIQSESKSQQGWVVDATGYSCEQSLRRYNLKANHNVMLLSYRPPIVVSNHYEDTIWKQITTERGFLISSIMLWAIITKIQSESKSQQSL